MFKLALGALVLVASSAMAEGSKGSEFFYQTGAGGHDLTPALGHSTKNEETSASGVSSKEDLKATSLSVEYGYGINEMLSIGAIINYTTGSTDDGTNSTDFSGLGNIVVPLKGTMAAGPGAFKFGGNLSLSPGNGKLDATSFLPTNNYSGGHSLTPYVGYEYGWNNCIFAGKLSRDMNLGKRKYEAGATEIEIEGGESTRLDLVYEHGFGGDMDLSLGLDLSYTMTGDWDITTGGTTTTDEQITPNVALKAYVPMKVGSGTLLPALTYGGTTDDKVGTDDVDSNKIMNLEVGYRMNF